MQEYVARDQNPWSWDNVKLPLPSGGWVPHPENVVSDSQLSENLNLIFYVFI